MKKITLLLALTGFLMHYSNAQNCLCGKTTELKVAVGPFNTTLPPGTSNARDSAKQEWKDWVIAQILLGTAEQGCGDEDALTQYECGDCNTSPCPYKLHKGCEEAGLTVPNGEVPTISSSNNNTEFSANADGCVKVNMECNPCVADKDSIKKILNTMAMCDNMPNQSILSVPIANIPNDTPISVMEAQQYWLDWIVAANGNDIPGSEPWGCPSCSGMPEDAPCQMVVDPGMSSPLPTPGLNPETNLWEFPPTQFILAYSCSPCGPQPKLKKHEASTLSSLALWPNITKSDMRVAVTLPNARTQAMILVLDITGREVANEYLPTTDSKINLDFYVGEWQAGTYFMQLVIDGTVSQTTRFMVIE